jgi:hypothetical protein
MKVWGSGTPGNRVGTAAPERYPYPPDAPSGIVAHESNLGLVADYSAPRPHATRSSRGRGKR